MMALILLTTSVVTWTPATLDTQGNPIYPSGADVQVFVRTVTEQGVSAWQPSNILRVCEPDYVLTADRQCVANSCHP